MNGSSFSEGGVAPHDWCRQTYYEVVRVLFVLGFLVSVAGNSLVLRIYRRAPAANTSSFSLLVFIIALSDMVFTVVVLPVLALLSLHPGLIPDRTTYNLVFHTALNLANLFTVQLSLFVVLERFYLYRHAMHSCSAHAKVLAALLLDLSLAPLTFVLRLLDNSEYLKVYFMVVMPLLVISGSLAVMLLNAIVLRLASSSVRSHQLLTRDVRRAREAIRKTSSHNSDDAGGQRSRWLLPRLVNIHPEERSMMVALIAATTVSCAFCMPRVELIVEYVRQEKFRIHDCIIRHIVFDFLPYGLNYINYAISPVIYWLMSSRFRADVRELLQPLLSRRGPRQSRDVTSAAATATAHTNHRTTSESALTIGTSRFSSTSI